MAYFPPVATAEALNSAQVRRMPSATPKRGSNPSFSRALAMEKAVLLVKNFRELQCAGGYGRLALQPQGQPLHPGKERADQGQRHVKPGRTAAGGGGHDFQQLAQGDGAGIADDEYFAHRLRADGAQGAGMGEVVDMDAVAQAAARADERERSLAQRAEQFLGARTARPVHPDGADHHQRHAGPHCLGLNGLLSGQLALFIDQVGMAGGRFIGGRSGDLAIDPDGAAVHEAADAGRGAEADQFPRPVAVDAPVGFLAQADRQVGAGQMKDHVGSRHDRFHRLQVGDVGQEDLQVGAGVQGVQPFPVQVHGAHAGAAGQLRPDQVQPHEPVGAGDDGDHLTVSTTTA